MKKVFVSAILLLTTMNAFALSAKDSWDKINASYEYIVQAPYSGFGPEGAFNMCQTPTTLQSIKPVAVCTQWSEPTSSGDTYTPSECVKSELRPVAIARQGVAAVCTDYKAIGEGDAYSGFECVKYENRAYDLVTTMNLNVIYAQGDQYPNVAFTKSYSLPICK